MITATSQRNNPIHCLQGVYDASGTAIQELVWLGGTPVAVIGKTPTMCTIGSTGDDDDHDYDDDGKNTFTSNTISNNGIGLSTAPFVANGANEGLDINVGDNTSTSTTNFEWSLGANTTLGASSNTSSTSSSAVTGQLAWVDERTYPFTLTYDNNGNGNLTVANGTNNNSNLINLHFTGSAGKQLRNGNALQLSVKSASGIQSTISLNLDNVDGSNLNNTITSNNSGAAQTLTLTGTSLTNGFTLKGNITINFKNNEHPTGTQLSASIRTGTIICTTAGEVSYIYSDHLNTPRSIINRDGQTIWNWESLPFGETVPNENPSGLGAFNFNHRFAGQYFDKETGLHQNYFRDYDPKMGRYIESDPIGLEGGLNRFEYASNNPITNMDITGLDWFRPDGHYYIVGRPGTPVEPGIGIGRLLEDYFPGMHTLGLMHDPLVDFLTAHGIPDLIANVPTMPATYLAAVAREVINSISKFLGNELFPHSKSDDCPK